MELRELEFGTEGYRAALDLRYRVLREPLGVEWTDEERAWEPRERHFGLMDGGEMVACVVVRPVADKRVKVRQMAVEPDRQRAGLGRGLLKGVEALLGSEGVREVELNAREVAVGFYERAGYARVGGQFTEVGIPHWRMEKTIPGD